MKLLSVLLAGLSMLFFLSCETKPSKGVDKNTGGYYIEKGISCNGVAMEINGEEEYRNEFIFGEKVRLIFKDITGFKSHEESFYPELELKLVNLENDNIEHKMDETKLEFGNEEVVDLYVNFTVALPYRNDEKYEAQVTISDQKGEGSYHFNFPFSAKENELLKIKNKGLEYSNIYLWNNTLNEGVFNKHLKQGHELYIILEGLDGFNEVENKVYPKLSLELYDGNDSIRLYSENVLEEFEDTGIEADQISDNQLYATILFGKKNIVNPYTVVCILSDQKSDKSIVMQSELMLINN